MNKSMTSIKMENVKTNGNITEFTYEGRKYCVIMGIAQDVKTGELYEMYYDREFNAQIRKMF